MVQTETIFDRTMQEVMPRLTEFNDYDLIIGIPFYDEKETLIPLIRSIDRKSVV